MTFNDRLLAVFGDRTAPDGSLVREKFVAWFGGSKVIDDNGMPLVVYHGTKADFTTFAQGSDLGLHFGDSVAANDRAQAEGVADGGSVIPVYLSIKNPLRMEDTFGSTFHSVEDAISQLIEEEILTEGEASKITCGKGVRSNEADAIKGAWFKVQEAIERAGYDGIVYENEWEGGESWIAFRPEQIKSAIGNSGAYDPCDPDMSDRNAVVIANVLRAKAVIHCVDTLMHPLSGGRIGSLATRI